ncbi:fibronectin type III domain-containing protein [Ekhidna sp.]|uniref:fibronectin type III domain-containing protein n=1 Tax=Ekhidna sp. TaxID=2608089 RepID=UPI003517C518
MRFNILLIFIFALNNLFGQESRVLVRNSPSNNNEINALEIKWYSNEFPFYKEGCHVYRRQAGTVTWEKITTNPVAQIADFDTTQYYQDDPDIGFYTEVVKQITPEQMEDAGLLFVNILIKSFGSPHFAEFIGNIYIDDDVINGLSYEYKVNKIVEGRELFLGQSKPILAGIYNPEKPVEGFTVEQQDTTFVIDWEVDPELFYATNLYQYTDSLGEVKVNPNPLLVSERRDTSGVVGYPSPKFVIRDLKVGETYTYTIAGLDFFGAETQRSEAITLKMKDITPPPPPTNFSGKADSMKVHLNWEFQKTEDFREVKLYRSMLSDGPFEVIYNSSTSIHYTDSISIPGPYYYYLTSNDIHDNEAKSRKIFIEVQDVIPPSQPQNLTIEADTGKILLRWDANPDPDLKGYLVYRTVNKNINMNYVLLNSEPLIDTYLEQQLPRQTKNDFFYYVIAIDTMFNRSNPSEFVFAQMPDIIAPERPHIKRVYEETESNVIEWVLNVDNDLMGYQVYRSDSLNGPASIINTSVISKDIGRFTDRAAQGGRTYYYMLAALDSAGNQSELSLPFSSFRRPRGNTENHTIKVKHTFNKRNKTLSLRWETTKTDILGFVIFSGTSASTLKPSTGLINQTSYKLKHKENYKYEVRVYSKSTEPIRSELINPND